MDMRIDVYHHIVQSEDDQTILTRLDELGETMSALSDAVDRALASEADEDARQQEALNAKDAVIADLQQQLSDVGAQLTTAMSNDAADAQAIADAQQQLAQQAADTQAQIDRLNEAFPTVVTSTDQTVEVTPPSDNNPPAVDNPPADSGTPVVDPTAPPMDSPPVDASPSVDVPPPSAPVDASPGGTPPDVASLSNVTGTPTEPQDPGNVFGSGSNG